MSTSVRGELKVNIKTREETSMWWQITIQKLNTLQLNIQYKKWDSEEKLLPLKNRS